MYRSMSSILSIAILVVSSATWPSRDVWAANLVYTNSFDSGLGANTVQHGGCYSYSFGNVTSPVLEGSQSVKITNIANQDNMNCSDTYKTGKHRAQLQLDDQAVKSLFSSTGVDTWTGFSVYVPSNAPTGNPVGYIMYQHNGGDGGPEFSIIYEDNGNDWKVTVASGSGADRRSIKTIPILKGQWSDFVIYKKRVNDASGVITIWINGTQYGPFNGPNAMDYPKGVNSVLGIYWGTESYNATHTLYFDSVRIASGANGYDLVSPSGGSVVAAPSAPTGLQIITPN